MGLLEGKSIFVTGGSSGIGRAIALAAGREGARHVWVASRNPEPHEGGETTVDLLHAAGTASEFVTLDVADTAAVFAAIEATKTQGGVDVMVCSAGINAKEDFLAITPEQFDRMKAVNLDGTLFAAQAAAKQMVAMEKRGAIVVIGSIGGLRGMRFSTMYSGLKAALINMTAGHSHQHREPRHHRDLACHRPGAGVPGDDRQGRTENSAAASGPAERNCRGSSVPCVRSRELHHGGIAHRRWRPVGADVREYRTWA